MITYIEKGIGLHEKIAALGHQLAEVDGVWTSSDDAAVQAIIDGYTLDECKERIVQDIDAHAAELRNKVVQNVSPAEMASWPLKCQEATKYQTTSNPADCPILAKEATLREIPVSDLANLVVAKAQQLMNLEAEIAGTAGKHKSTVRQLATFEEVLAYDWRAGWPVV